MTAEEFLLQGPNNLAEHYTSKYLDLELGPLLPFGHGLSYTAFALGRFAVPDAPLDGRGRGRGRDDHGRPWP